MKAKTKVLETVDINPSTNIIEVLSNSGYTLNSAIADIMDNSLTAKATEIDIRFYIDGKNSKITILDNGYGMNGNTIIQALKYSPNKVDMIREIHDTGRYGVGLKSAASAIANRLIVSSIGSDKVLNTFLVDFESMINKNQWQACKIQNSLEYNVPNEQGTLITLEGLKIDEASSERKETIDYEDLLLGYMDSLKNHIAKTYYYYIQKGLKIRLNGKAIEGWSPFSVGKNCDNAIVVTVYDEEIKVKDSKIRISGFVLPPFDSLDLDQKSYVTNYGSGLEELQGFYFYRGNRLIHSGGWFNMEGLSISSKYNYARIGIFVDNTLDKYLKVNFLKNSINPPVEFKNMLTRIARKVRSAAAKSFNIDKDPRPYAKTKKNTLSPWVVTHTDNGIKVKINKNHPTIQYAFESIPKAKQNILFNLLEKTIPIAEFQTLEKYDNSYSEEQLLDLLNDMYDSLYKNNKTINEIKNIILSTEPFNNEDYKSIVLSFLVDKVEEDEE